MISIFQKLVYPWFLIWILCSIPACKKSEKTIDKQTNGRTTAIFNPDVTYGTMTDQDGNIYKTVVIGTQTWMAENLRTGRYANGDSITFINLKEFTENFINRATGACCNYHNTKYVDTIATYGKFYNWYAVNDNRGIGPPGWHVPSTSEWQVLFNFGGDTTSGKLKEIGTYHWRDPNTGATNSTGFTAMPAGMVFNMFYPVGEYGIYWTSTLDFNGIHLVYFSWNNEICVNKIDFANTGYCVRLIKDN